MPAPLFRIAIVGRPNVGKSSLLNMLATRRVSIVDDTPGTTRDRVSAIVDLHGEDEAGEHLYVEVTDTGGYGVYTAEGRRVDDAGKDLSALTGDIEKQINAAVQAADLVLFVVDTQAGLTPLDREVARLLREGGLAPADGAAGAKEGASAAGKVILIANKCDGPRWEMHALEAAALGFGEPLIVSAKNNYYRRDLVEKLFALVKERQWRRKGGGAEAERPEMKLAIVGKRNAGKSTLVNTLAGEERVIVSEIAGTTRDAIDVRFDMGGKSFIAIDTAGVRRKRSLQDRIEWWALERAIAAIERSDVCLLLIDATVPVSMVDKQLGRVIGDRFKPCVIVVNKWDLAEGRPLAGAAAGGRPVRTGDYERYLRDELKGLANAPIAFVSAEKNHNLRPTIELAFELYEQAGTRVGTGQLNRMVRELFRTQGPTNRLGSRLKLFFVTQADVHPPTIVMVVNKPEMFTDRYERFLLNRFREELPFPEVPVKLVVRPRRQDEVIDEAMADGTAGEAPAPTPEEAAARQADLDRHAGIDVNATDWSVEPLDAADVEKLFTTPMGDDADEPGEREHDAEDLADDDADDEDADDADGDEAAPGEAGPPVSKGRRGPLTPAEARVAASLARSAGKGRGGAGRRARAAKTRAIKSGRPLPAPRGPGGGKAKAGGRAAAKGRSARTAIPGGRPAQGGGAAKSAGGAKTSGGARGDSRGSARPGGKGGAGRGPAAGQRGPSRRDADPSKRGRRRR